MTWDEVVGWLTGAALAVLAVVALVSSARRERRGPEPRVTTVAGSRPIWSGILLLSGLAAVALVTLRLGYLS